MSDYRKYDHKPQRKRKEGEERSSFTPVLLLTKQTIQEELDQLFPPALTIKVL